MVAPGGRPSVIQCNLLLQHEGNWGGVAEVGRHRGLGRQGTHCGSRNRERCWRLHYKPVSTCHCFGCSQALFGRVYLDGMLPRVVMCMCVRRAATLACHWPYNPTTLPAHCPCRPRRPLPLPAPPSPLLLAAHSTSVPSPAVPSPAVPPPAGPPPAWPDADGHHRPLRRARHRLTCRRRCRLKCECLLCCLSGLGSCYEQYHLCAGRSDSGVYVPYPQKMSIVRGTRPLAPGRLPSVPCGRWAVRRAPA